MKKSEFLKILSTMKCVSDVLDTSKKYSDVNFVFYSINVRFITDNVYYHCINIAVKNDEKENERVYYVNSDPPLSKGAKVDEYLFILALFSGDLSMSSKLFSDIDKSVRDNNTSSISDALKQVCMENVFYSYTVPEIPSFKIESQLKSDYQNASFLKASYWQGTVANINKEVVADSPP